MQRRGSSGPALRGARVGLGTGHGPAPRAGRPGRHLVLWVTPHPGWWEVGLLACQVGGAAWLSPLCTRGTHTSNPNRHLQDLMVSQLCTAQGRA